VVRAEVTQRVEGLVRRGIFRGPGEGRGFFENFGPVGALYPMGCAGRQEGRSQHKTVSRPSFDSDVVQPRKKTTLKRSPKSVNNRENMIGGCQIAWSGKFVQTSIGEGVSLLF